MANKNHLEILKQGTEPWNRWRKKNHKIQSSLDMADLRGAKLRMANLRGTILIETVLQRADLTGCSVYGVV